jgi:hypothetical protein
MTEPTKEQIQKFWEWCRLSTDSIGRWYTEDGYFLSSETPKVDLNNLFKYAVPKLNMPIMLSTFNEETEVILPSYFPDANTPEEDFMSPPLSVKRKDPALALFCAIWEVIK